MRRKSAILLLILLLLLGGGGVAFYSHLRKHDAPPLQEVMSYFSDSSSSIGIGEGWRLVAYESFTSKIFNPHPWLASLGFERKDHETDIFRFERESTGETAELTLVHVEKKILEATFSASSPTAAFSLEQNVLRKFPHLARRLKPSHGSALPPP